MFSMLNYPGRMCQGGKPFYNLTESSSAGTSSAKQVTVLLDGLPGGSAVKNHLPMQET